MVALNFDCAVSHSIDGLINDNGGMWLAHDFVDLVAFCSYEEGDHALRDKNYDGKRFPT